MAGLVSFVKRHPVLTYYLLVFLISFGGIIIVLGLDGFLGITQTARTQLFVGGPISLLGPSISGILMTGIVYGRPGLRNLITRLLRWRVGIGWYAFALLLAPVLSTLLLLARSLTPAIATAEDKISLLLTGIMFGLVSSPFFEELGWIGFATPELRKRFGVLATGLMMGVLWGLWHYPIFSASGRASGPLSPIVFTLLLLFTWLIPYRILIVWLYDHTQSLLLAFLMHVPIVVDQFVLAPSVSSPEVTAASNLLLAAALWIMVAVIFVVNHGRLEARAEASLRAA